MYGMYLLKYFDMYTVYQPMNMYLKSLMYIHYCVYVYTVGTYDVYIYCIQYEYNII